MDDLQGRGNALENAFFLDRDQELLQKLKAEVAGKETQDAMRSVSGIDDDAVLDQLIKACLLYTSPSPRDRTRSRMPSSA